MKLTKGCYDMKFSPSPDITCIHSESPEVKADYRKNLPGPMHTPPRLRIIKNCRENRKVLLYDEGSHYNPPQQEEFQSGHTIGRKTEFCFYFIVLTLIALCFGAYTVGSQMMKYEKKLDGQFCEYEKILAKKSDLKSSEKALISLKSELINELGALKQLVNRIVEELVHLQLKSEDKGGVHLLEKLYGKNADYALEQNGGNIYSILTTRSYAPNSVAVTFYGITLWKHIWSNPCTVIKGVISPGECWAFQGSEGSIVIQLANAAIITSVVVEHIPKSLTTTGNTDSAPKEFSICAYETVDYFPDKCLHLGNFEYDAQGPPRQEFYVELKTQSDGTAMSFRFLRFDFLTNYGNEVYTCVYRLRVYGRGEDNFTTQKEMDNNFLTTL